ncbi:uncharacterized protein RCH25_004617 [Pelodytes ibericus]
MEKSFDDARLTTDTDYQSGVDGTPRSNLLTKPLRVGTFPDLLTRFVVSSSCPLNLLGADVLSRLQASISFTPDAHKPLHAFLGLLSYCRPWIPEASSLMQPLYDALKSEPFALSPEALTSFFALRRAVASAPALGIPNYQKPFKLFVYEKMGHASGVLTQSHGSRQRPIGYYSCQLDPVARGGPSCLRAVFAASALLDKTNDLILGSISRGSRFCYNMNYFVYFFLLLGLIKAQQVAITKDNHVYTFWYNSSSTRVATFTFDYCDVVNCTFPWSLSSTVYKDIPNMKDPYICVTDDYWGYECSSWKAAGWNTGSAWGYRPQSALDRLDENGESLLKRMTFRKPGGATPIRLALNIEHPSPGDAGQYVMGMYWKGGGSYSKQGTFYLRDMYDSPEWVDAAHMTINPLKPHIKTLRDMIAIANPTYEDTMAVETGFFDTNLWLEWMRYNANKHNRSNCYVCGGARPHLGTVPLNIPPEIEMCFLSLYTAIKTDRTECESWTKEYPIILKDVKPDKGITIYPGNYTCYGIYDGVGQFFGNFTGKYCATYSPIPAALIQQHVRSLGDIYWICGDMQIRTRLEGVWWGECALAKITCGHLGYAPWCFTKLPSRLWSAFTLAGSTIIYLDNILLVAQDPPSRNVISEGSSSLGSYDWIVSTLG